MPNVIHNPIVNRDKIIFPPLYIKLGLMKQFVCFQHLIYTFPGLSYEKIKAGIFNGPQIRTLVCDQGFTQTMNDKEKAAWLSFVDVTENFLGNKKAQNYENLVSNMLSAFHHLASK